MTRKEFLNDVYRHLYGLTQDQAEQHLTYYAEMLADRIEEGMTEDEAVASMEDVETIARRIMEEEGLPYTPPEERPVMPPQYPDASRLQGGGGKRGYQVPKKWSVRKIVQTALWTVAAIALVSAVGRWAWRSVYARPYAPEPTDYITEAAAIDTPIREYDGYYEEAPYVEGGYEYGSGSSGTWTDSIERIDIQWAAGTVYIQSWSSDEIEVREYAHSELSSRTSMSCQEDGGTLTIRYRDGLSLGGVKDDKWLTVLIPDGMVGELKIETTSADVRLNGLETETLTVSTASGDIQSTECYTQTAELSSISGYVNLYGGLYADSLDLTTTSGDISGDVTSGIIGVSTISGDISLYGHGSTNEVRMNTTSGDIWCSVEDPSVQSIGISSTSGDISLSLPYDMGFTLEYDTVSGDFLNSYFEMSQQNGKYVCNGGGCEIEVDTVSGNLDVY